MSISEQQEQLLQKSLSGDRAALVELLEELGPVVRVRIEPKIGRHLKVQIDADDVMQVTYIEAVTRIGAFEGDGRGFLAWLTRIAENNLIDAARMMESAKRPNPKNRITHGTNDESMVALVEALGATYTTPSRAAARNEMGGALDAALAKLPDAYAKVIRLYDLQGWSVQAVSDEMGRSEGAIYMLRARAHDRLRDVLGDESQFFTVHGG